MDVLRVDFISKLEYIMETPVEIPEGVTLEQLVQIYNKQKEHLAKRREWFKTEEGREYNRQKAAVYYDRNKEKVLAKAKTRYEGDKERHNAVSLASYYKKKEEKALAEKRRIEQAVESLLKSGGGDLEFSPQPSDQSLGRLQPFSG